MVPATIIIGALASLGQKCRDAGREKNVTELLNIGINCFTSFEQFNLKIFFNFLLYEYILH